MSIFVINTLFLSLNPRQFFCLFTQAKLLTSTRLFLFLIFLLVGVQFIYAQKQSKTILIEGGYTFDLASNFKGGIETGSAFLGNIDLTFDFDLEALDLWAGGHFFVYLLNNHGNSLSELLGDFQMANNIEAESHTRLFEIWYEQSYKSFSFLLGQHDLNSVFAISETGLNFINNSFGAQPDLSENFPASVFPLTTLGFIVNWSLNDNIHFAHAVYDGDPGSESDNPNSLNWRLNKEEGALLINEVQFQIKKDSLLKSVYKLGIWNHTQNQTINEVLFTSSQGVYFLSDQKLIQNTSNGIVLNAFSQLGISLSTHNPVAAYLGGGFWFQGLSPKRAEDGIGIAVAHANFSDYYKSKFEGGLKNETALELTYQWVTNRKWRFQPNFQYIINPASQSRLTNAFMGLVRFNYAW